MMDVALQHAAFGDAVRRARHERKWLQKDLAAAVHVEPTTISRWERGENRPRFDTVETLAAALQKPVSYFVADGEVTLDQEQGEVLADRLEALLDRLETLLGEPQAAPADQRGREAVAPGRTAR